MWCESHKMVREGSEGEIKDEFCLEELLYRGNFAYSYRGKDINGHEYFIKEYADPKNVEVQKKEFDQFYNNILAVEKRLRKIPDAAVQIKKIFIDGPMLYVVYDFMKGLNLMEMLKTAKDLDREKRKIFALIFISALSRIHSVGLVHSDLKPEQIFLEENPNIELGWRVYVADFDFALVYDGDKLISKPHTIAFTPGYQSPEHLKGITPTRKSDIFTAGIILYQILFNRHAFTTEGVLYEEAALKGVPVFIPHEKYPWIPEDISLLMVRMFSIEPSKRPEAHELVRAFAQWIRKKEKPPKATEAPKEVTLFKRVILKDTKSGLKIRIWKSGIVTKYQLRILGNDANQLPQNVFEIKKQGGNWLIGGISTSPPVIYNGTDITGKLVSLEKGGHLEIGNISLVVEFE